mmetsp:Transcript_12237/g.34005  ORF Transcript_12237/g.34005 Transcript_12237/m.34005 type:complete len:208 (+) Transcript_12237:2781-3404(+)
MMSWTSSKSSCVVRGSPFSSLALMRESRRSSVWFVPDSYSALLPSMIVLISEWIVPRDDLSLVTEGYRIASRTRRMGMGVTNTSARASPKWFTAWTSVEGLSLFSPLISLPHSATWPKSWLKATLPMMSSVSLCMWRGKSIATPSTPEHEAADSSHCLFSPSVDSVTTSANEARSDFFWKEGWHRDRCLLLYSPPVARIPFPSVAKA